MIEAKPIERVTPLAPGEALRLGRLRAPHQLYSMLFYDMPDGQLGACAAGAMILGYGGDPDAFRTSKTFARAAELEDALPPFRALPGDSLLAHWPAGYQPRNLPCPHGNGCEEGREMNYTTLTMLMHLNDEHEWSTEALAEWLEAQA